MLRCARLCCGARVLHRLSYFTELERLSQTLNPSLSLLNESSLNDKFIPLLTRLDECIAYISAHPQYKDSTTFLARFRQLQNKAMSRVKNHVKNTLMSATQGVMTQVQGTDEGPDASFTLFYGKFRMHAPKIKTLMSEIEKRGKDNDDYATLLQDCYSCYIQQRSALLLEPIGKKVTEILSKSASDFNLPGMMRASCAYMVRICRHEYQLYEHFFTTNYSALDELLENLTNVLYESFRPLYISHAALDSLVELCAVLKTVFEDNTGTDINAFALVIEQMLQDVQQKISHKTQAYTQSDIIDYMPSTSDLDYPGKLEKEKKEKLQKAAEKSADGAKEPEVDGDVEKNATAEPPILSSDVYKTWYPTLPRTVLLLSKLYRSVERGVFEGLAQELVHGCVTSLFTAFDSITQTRGLMHGQLFLVKHLLILREQITPFEASFSIMETNVDFEGFMSGLKGVYDSIIAKDNTWLNFFSLENNVILKAITNATPQILETRSDARQYMDDKLKSVCQEYFQSQVKAILGALISFVQVYKATAGNRQQEEGSHVVKLTEPEKAKLQKAYSPEKLRKCVVDFEKLMRTQTSRTKGLLTLYLANAKTERVCLGSIMNEVLQIYQKFLHIVESVYAAEGKGIIGAPTVEQVRMTLAV